MGVYANYTAAPPEVIAAHLDDFDGLAELSEAPGSPCRPFSLAKAWREVWRALEPEAFAAVVPPEQEPPAPAGLLGAAVVGARPLNAAHSRVREEAFVGVYDHTRALTADEVRAAAVALDALPPGLGGEGVSALRSFYRAASADGMGVVVMIG